eukprot:8370962-Karenia_brevis.AAC.1
MRSSRVNAWKDWARKAWSKGGRGKVCRALQSKRGGSVSLLQRSDGTFTGNAHEIDKLLHEAWDPVFMAYADVPEPGWQPFFARFAEL